MRNPQIAQAGLYGFYLTAILNLIEQVLHLGWLNMATKPLLMVTLLTYYLAERNEKLNTISKLMIGALLFSWLGDVLLMLQGEFDNLFIYGLGSFLVAQIFYIFTYRKAVFKAEADINKSFINTRIVFLVFIGATLVFMLRPNLGDLLIPVFVYTVVIVAMGIFALLRRGKTLDKSFIFVYSGALLFIMSDAMIAIDRFMSPIIQSGLLIMATYIAAQFLIVKGILIHENGSEENIAKT